MLRAEITDHNAPAGDSGAAGGEPLDELGTEPTIAIAVGASGVTGLLASAGLFGMVLLGLLVAIAVNATEVPPSDSAAQVAPVSLPAAAPYLGESLFVSAADLRRWQNEGIDVLLLDAREPPQWGTPLHVRNTSCALPWKSLSHWEEGGADKSVLLPVSMLQQQLRECGMRRDRSQRIVVYGDWAAAWGEEGRLFWTLEYLSPANEGRVYVLRGGFAAWQEHFPGGEQVSTTLTRGQAGDFVAAEQPIRRLLKPQITSALTTSASDSSTGLLSPRRLRLLDSREPEEYTGAVDPYGVARPGHVPGAVSFPWKTVFQSAATTTDHRVETWPDLLPCDTLRPRFLNALLRSTDVHVGDGSETQMVLEVGTYCTGKQQVAQHYQQLKAASREPRAHDVCVPSIGVRPTVQVESGPVSCILCCGSAFLSSRAARRAGRQQLRSAQGGQSMVLQCKWILRTTTVRCGSGQMTLRLRWLLAIRLLATPSGNTKGLDQAISYPSASFEGAAVTLKCTNASGII
jgi:3-mercaptopyruvate sulfurtransferase SseA